MVLHLTDGFDGFLFDKRCLILDRDRLLTPLARNPECARKYLLDRDGPRP